MSIRPLGDPNVDGVILHYGGGLQCETEGGAPRSTEIEIECDPAAGQGFIEDINEPFACEYSVRMKSQHGCALPPGEDDGGKPSGDIDSGWIFIIILGSVVIVYLIGGVIVKKKFYQAEGSDAIPNLGFWKELPSLAKDGIVFTVAKIRERMNK